MKETNLKSTKSNLIKVALMNSTPETIAMYSTEIADCRTNAEKLEWTMECWYTYTQPVESIVKNLTTGTWNLTENEDEALDAENSLNFADWT